MNILTHRKQLRSMARRLQRAHQAPRSGARKQGAPKLARRTRDPRMKLLQSAAGELALGSFRIDVPTGNDDIGQVGQALERLAEKFGARIEHILRLLRLSEGINSTSTLDEALDYLYYSFRTIIPYDRIGCSLLSDDQKSVSAVWAKTKVGQKALGLGYTAPLAGSSLETILRSRQPRILGDLEAYLAAHPNSSSTRLIVSEGMRSSLTCPILAMGQPVGFLFFSSRERNAYSNVHVEFYQQISRVIGMVVERARLYEQVVLARDALEEANRKLQCLVDVDGLTMIPNRRAFDHRLGIEWRRAQRGGKSLSILMVDVDDFKLFNDTYGHLAGDDCLKKIAAAISNALCRAGDFVARFGGEEFAVVLPNTSAEQVGTVAERCLQAVRDLNIPHQGARGGAIVTLSMGGATWSGEPDIDLTGLLWRADTALYGAKDSGRNTYRLTSGNAGSLLASSFRVA